MDSRTPLNPESPPCDTAADWFALRQRRPDADVEERFARWIAEDPQRKAEYAIHVLKFELHETAAYKSITGAPKRRWYRKIF